MTTHETTMNDIADGLDEVSENIDGSVLHEGNELQEFASKTVYSTFYYFSYGVCFVGLLAGKAIPKTGVIGQGLRDGSQAAREAVERITSQPAALKDDFEEPITAEEDEEAEEPVIPATAKRKSPAAKSKRVTKAASAN